MNIGFDAIILTDIFPQKFWSRSIGAYRIANELRSHGYSCKVINGFTDFSAEELVALVESCIGPETSMIGLSCTFVGTHSSKGYFKSARSAYPDSFRTCLDEIKARHPRIKIVVGGSTASGFELACADIYVYGFGEEGVIQIMRSLKSGTPPQGEIIDGRFVVHSKNTSLNFAGASTFYNDEDAIVPGETLLLELTRGCRFRCKFCAFPLNGRSKNDYYKDAELVRTELLENYERWGITTYILGDDTYNETVEKLEYYNKVFTSLPFRLNFSAYVRLDLVQRKPEMIDLMLKGGIRGAFFGIESLHEPAARAIGKNLSQKQTMETLYRLRREWGQEVVTSGGFIVGLPHDTPETIQNWIDLLLQEDFPLHNHQVNPLLIKAGNKNEVWQSEFERNPEKYGFRITVTNDPQDNRGVYWESSTMNSRQAAQIMAEYYAKYYSRPASYNCFSHTLMMGYGMKHEDAMALDLRSPADNQKIDALILDRIANYKAEVTRCNQPTLPAVRGFHDLSCLRA